MPPPMGSMPPPPGMMFPPGMPPVSAPGTPAMPPAEEIWVENKTPDGKVRDGCRGCSCCELWVGMALEELGCSSRSRAVTGLSPGPGLFLQRTDTGVSVDKTRRGQGHPAVGADAHAGSPGPGCGGLHAHHQQPCVCSISIHLLQHAVLHHLHHHHGHLRVPDQLQWVPGGVWGLAVLGAGGGDAAWGLAAAKPWYSGWSCFSMDCEFKVPCLVQKNLACKLFFPPISKNSSGLCIFFFCYYHIISELLHIYFLLTIGRAKLFLKMFLRKRWSEVGV